MKTILQLFRKAVGWPLLLWCVIFFIWRVTFAYYQAEPVSLYSKTDLLAKILVGFDLGGFVLSLWFLGYLFLVAIRTVAGEKRPLYPLALKDSFIMGIHIVFRFMFVLLPVIIFFGITVLWNGHNTEQFFNIFSLSYFILLFVPFCIYFAGNSEKLPYMYTWSFFKENLDRFFLFLFLSALSYCLWAAAFDWMYSLGLDASAYTWREVKLFLLIYALLFYLMSFNAVLLGFFAKKTKVIPVNLNSENTVIPVQKAVVEEKTVVAKKTVAVKKAGVSKKSTVARKKGVKKTTGKKTVTKKKAKGKSVKK